MHKPYPFFRPKRRGTYLHSLYKGLTPGAKNAWQITSLAAYASETNKLGNVLGPARGRLHVRRKQPRSQGPLLPGPKAERGCSESCAIARGILAWEMDE